MLLVKNVQYICLLTVAAENTSISSLGKRLSGYCIVTVKLQGKSKNSCQLGQYILCVESTTCY